VDERLVQPLELDFLVDYVNEYAVEPRAASGTEHLPYPDLAALAEDAPAALALVTEMGSDLREGELVQLADRLYEVFVKARTDPGQELDSINALLRRSAAAPHLSRQANRIVADWRLEGRVRRDDPVSGLLQAACVLALYEWLSGAGSLERIGVCSAHRCVDIFIDGSQAGSRRYCSDICGNRAKVAAHRARLRARSGLTPSGRSPRDEHQATK
jgi:predicted RNA-binding Zn ribbon-like protein